MKIAGHQQTANFSYACLLSLTTMHEGHYGPFFNLRLPDTLSDKSFAPRIDDMQPQIFPEHPRIGDTVYIECFAYGRSDTTDLSC